MTILAENLIIFGVGIIILAYVWTWLYNNK